MITIELPAHFQAKPPELSNSGLTRFLNRARRAVGLPGEVEVLLADDSTLRSLNKSFRGKNKPTDVLSFPTPAEIAHAHAGDLAISLETAARQAAAYGHTLRDEVRILVLHGLLHLAGEDHETDNGEMATREATLRRELRLPTTLIERIETPRKIAKPGSKSGTQRSKTSKADTKIKPPSREALKLAIKKDKPARPTKPRQGWSA
jgi:probable rRNA maturation factor